MHSWWSYQMETFPCYWPFVKGIHRSPMPPPPFNSPRGHWVTESFNLAWSISMVNSSLSGSRNTHISLTTNQYVMTGEFPAQMASNAENVSIWWSHHEVLNIERPAVRPTWDTFYWHGLTLIPAWISNHKHIKAWDEITYPFPNFNGCTVEVWEWICNFTPHYIMDVITYPG